MLVVSSPITIFWVEVVLEMETRSCSYAPAVLLFTPISVIAASVL